MQKSVLFFIKASLKSVIFYSFYMCLLSFCFFFWGGGKVYSSLFFFNQQKFKVKAMTHNISGILSCFTFEIYIYWVFSQDVFVCNAHSIHIHMNHQRNHNNSWAPVILYKLTWKVRLVVRALGTTIFWPFLFSVSF